MDKNQRYAFVTTVFLKDVYQSAIASGGLSLLDTELLMSLGDSYRHLRGMDTWSEVIRSMISTSGGPNSENVKQVIILMEVSGKEAIKSVSKTIEVVTRYLGAKVEKRGHVFPYFWECNCMVRAMIMLVVMSGWDGVASPLQCRGLQA